MNGDKQSIDGIIAFLNKGPLNDETGKNAIYIHRSLCYRYKPFTVSCESTTYFWFCLVRAVNIIKIQNMCRDMVV